MTNTLNTEHSVNFTREPIIETVITPREGCKLVVRSSKGGSQEDYFVDAVEVVSFGHSFFFRSLERPKSFLVPVSDYEILELKETRMVLKNVSPERSIKIGGGRESPPPPRQQQPRETAEESVEEVAPQIVERGEKKKGRRSRRRRSSAEPRNEPQGGGQQNESVILESEEGVEEGEEAAPSFISKLFPPPPTLIKETLSRYKTSEEGILIEQEPSASQEGIFEHPVHLEEHSETEKEEQPLPDPDTSPIMKEELKPEE